MQISIHTTDLGILIALCSGITFIAGLGLGNIVLYLRWRKYQHILDSKEERSDVS